MPDKIPTPPEPSDTRHQYTSTMFDHNRTILDTNTSILTLQPNRDLDPHPTRGFLQQSTTPNDPEEEPQQIEQTKVVLKKIDKNAAEALSPPLSQSMDPTWRTLRSEHMIQPKTDECTEVQKPAISPIS